MWTSFELLKSSGFLGYPWALLPYTQTSFLTILQVADRTGVYGLSFMLSLANASLGELLWGGQTSGAIEPRGWGAISLVRGSRGRRRIHVKIAFPESRRLATGAIVYHLGAAAAIFALVLGYGLWRLGTPIPERASLKVLIVQQNSNPWSDGTEAGLVVNMNLMRSALKKGEIRPDLVLFSESSLGRPYIDNRAYYETTPKGDPFLPYLRSTGLWLFTGSPVILDWKELSATNSVMLIDPRGRPVDTYAKMQLVPFGESIPFMEYSWFKTFMKAAVGLEGGWTMGTRYTLFRMPIPTGELRFGAPICFEDAFAPLCRQFVLEGADILVNLTDDSWSRTTSAEVQHLAAARFRSIETRRAQVRSTNSGVSGVIGPFGDIRQTLPLFVAAESIVEVPLVDPEPTAYLAYGEWFAIATLLLSFIWSLILAGRDILSQRRKV
jgi:apolipoprotein N-acyltransferase